MPVIPFWPLNVVVALLSTQGQKFSDFIKNMLFFFVFQKWTCFEDRIFILGWTIPWIDLNQVRYHIEFTWMKTMLWWINLQSYNGMHYLKVLYSQLIYGVFIYWKFFLERCFISWTRGMLLNNSTIHWTHCTISHSLVFIPVENEIWLTTD